MEAPLGSRLRRCKRTANKPAAVAPGPSEPPVATLGWVAPVVAAAPARGQGGLGAAHGVTPPAAGKQLRGVCPTGPRGTGVLPARFAVPA